jgi:hypothetical protein
MSDSPPHSPAHKKHCADPSRTGHPPVPVPDPVPVPARFPVAVPAPCPFDPPPEVPMRWGRLFREGSPASNNVLPRWRCGNGRCDAANQVFAEAMHAGHLASPHPPGHELHPFTGIPHPDEEQDVDDCRDPNFFPVLYDFFLVAYPHIRNPTYRSDRGLPPVDEEHRRCMWCWTPTPHADRPVPRPTRADFQNILAWRDITYCTNCSYRFGWYVSDGSSRPLMEDDWEDCSDY